MKYQNSDHFTHDRQSKTGVLLVNLGTPDEPTPRAVRRYLAEFLSDPRVVEMPRLLWKMILHGIILNIRPKPVSKAYKSVWTDEGSPLLVHTRRITEALQSNFSDAGSQLEIEFAMRYGQPNLQQAMQRLREKNVERLLILPLYPQYSATTSASVFDAVTAILQKWRWIPELRFINQYHDHPEYINALAQHIQDHFAQNGQPDKLLFAFHGLPERYLRNGDPYFCQCQKTARLVIEQLKLETENTPVCFQSRFGREPWLQPYADATLTELAAQGTKHVQVISPGFSADCLETLEEMAMQNRDIFLKNGGQTFHYIPALNESKEHIHLLSTLIKEHTDNWPAHKEQTQAETSAALAKDLGAKK